MTTRKRFSPSIAARAPAGFTLLEVIVAIALAVLLLAAVYSGLSLYWKYTTAGKDEVERLQLARALLRRIELDLRSVVYHDAAATGVSTGGSGSGSGSGTGSGSSASGSGTASSGGSSSSSSSSSSSNRVTATKASASATSTSSSAASASSASSATGGSSTSDPATSTTATTPDAAMSSTASGLYGDANTLMMHICKPTRAEMYQAGSRISDLQAVAYFVAGQGGGTLAGSVNGGGLARMAGDRLLMQMSGQQSTASLLAQAELLAPEVRSLSFSYYDGTTWTTTWDSAAQSGLPKAVEVILELEPMKSTSGSSRSRQAASGSTALTVFQLMVALPNGKVTSTATSASSSY